MPDSAEACPECGKPVDKTGLGGTLKFFDMRNAVCSNGITYVIFPALLIALAIWECRDFFRDGFGLSNFGLFEAAGLLMFIAGMFFMIIGILHLKNAGKCFFSIKNHGVKAVYPSAFGTLKYLESPYTDISYAYIARHGKRSMLKIGTSGGEHKIRMLNGLDEQSIESHINTAISVPGEQEQED